MTSEKRQAEYQAGRGFPFRWVRQTASPLPMGFGAREENERIKKRILEWLVTRKKEKQDAM